MPKSQTLPEEWESGSLNTLNLAQHLGIRKPGVPSDLRIKRSPKSKNLIAQYLPAVEDDPRPGAGATRNGSGKRKLFESSMGTPDPWEAASRAVEWVKQHQRESRAEKDQQQNQKDSSLHAYWEKWFHRTSESKKTARLNYRKWEGEQQNLWLAQGYGLKHQPFALKSVDAITYSDLADYWTLIDQRRATSNRAGDMGGTKKQLKTLIKHLFQEARSDYPQLLDPKFPSISHQKKQSDHFHREEWEKLVRQVLHLTDGAGQKSLSPEEYQALHFKPANRQNQRYWVDFYDGLMLMWFFFLRAEDLPRLKAEWFRSEEGKGGSFVICRLEETKGNRPIRQTHNLRPDGYKVWERITKRKPSGYLLFPELDRNSVLQNFRFLLSKAKESCGITREGLSTTQVRHTAFRLLLEEDPQLHSVVGLNEVAAAGNTSAEQLRETYLNPIQSAANAANIRSRLKPADWSLVRRVDLKE